MGKDKGTLILEDQPLLLHVLESLPPTDEIILVLRDQKQYQDYKQILSTFKEVKVSLDREIDQGPLVGILTGLSTSESNKSLIIPCDSPLISATFVESMLEHPLEGYAALVPRWPNGQTEPLHAVYHKSKTLPVIEKLLKKGVRNVNALFNHLPVLYLEAESLDPGGDTFFNLNRPQDLENLKNR